MNHLTRRTFLKTSAFAAAGGALSARSWSQVAGANGDVRVAVIGLGGRGLGSHTPSLLRLPGVRIVALCDPDTDALGRARKAMREKGEAVKKFTDVRELLAFPDLDAVTIATPNHWHSLGAIWACQAGKDVYVVKPVSHNVWEGCQLVAAAAKYQRVVQAGTQIRSGEGLREAVAWVRAGHLGRVIASRGFCYKRRESIGKTSGPQPVPPAVNYDQWCGPAPMEPLRRKRLHYDWHWVDVTGNGDVGNQGIHQMDVARWFLGETGLPRSTLSVGGRLGYEDDGNTPNTQIVIHDYASAPLIFEVRGLPAGAAAAAPASGAAEGRRGARSGMDKYRDTTVSIGNVIECEGGRVVTDSYFTATAFDKAGKVIRQFKGNDTHMANFIDVVRSRKVADLRGPILEGHLSSALCHLGIISHKLGQAVPAGQLREKIKGNGPLAEAFGRMAEHLAANGVDLDRTPATLGVPLEVDAKAERFRGEFAKIANPLLTRQYRAPFVVPKIA